MGFSKCHLYFLWYSLLIAVLTYPTEESTIYTSRTKRFLWHQVEQTVEKMKDSISTSITKIFNTQFNDDTANKDESSTTTALPNVESRQIITAPIRCPTNHVNVNGKCRLNIDY